MKSKKAKDKIIKIINELSGLCKDEDLQEEEVIRICEAMGKLCTAIEPEKEND